MITRTTFIGSSNQMLQRTMDAQNSLYKTQEQALTLKKILVPSDDALGTSTIIKSNNSLGNISSYKDNISTLSAETKMTESIFTTMIDKMDRINELTVQAANGTNNAETLKAIQAEITELKSNIVDLANTKYNDKYIFSGVNTGTVPYSLEADGSIVYNGTKTLNPDGTIDTSNTDYQRKTEIAENVYMSVNYAGDSIFGTYDATTDPATGTGLFKTLGDLDAALTAPTVDFDLIREQIDKVQAGISTLSNYRSANGINAQRLDMTLTSLEDTELLITSQKSAVQDLDAAEAYTKYSKEMYTYQASLQISSSSLSSSLLNYL